jgi:hypothetical protein
MRFPISIALLALVLGGCMGPAGNPNAQSYVDEPGGPIGAKPQFLDTASYDPQPAPFADMRAGQAAITPPPPPMSPARRSY